MLTDRLVPLPVCWRVVGLLAHLFGCSQKACWIGQPAEPGHGVVAVLRALRGRRLAWNGGGGGRGVWEDARPEDVDVAECETGVAHALLLLEGTGPLPVMTGAGWGWGCTLV